MSARDHDSGRSSDAPVRPNTGWPKELASIGAIRFARAYHHYEEAVHFFRDLVGLPLYEQFEGSYGENGSIFGLPTPELTFEPRFEAREHVVEAGAAAVGAQHAAPADVASE